MPRKPKEKEKVKDEECEEPQKSSWSEDQKKRGYYYDDAHGYEIYQAGDDDQLEDND